MKIGFLTAYRGQKLYSKQYQSIINYLKKRGHSVITNLDIKLEKILSLTYSDREKIFLSFYKDLEKCNFVVAECSMQSTQVGFGISFLLSKGVPIILLSIKGVGTEFLPNVSFSSQNLNSNVENMMVYEYTDKTIVSILDEALVYMGQNIDKRFTIIFSSYLLAKVEAEAKRKKLPKAVYIRQLIEKNLTSSS